MTFYLLDDPAKPNERARFSHVGTWSDGSICKYCGELLGGELIEPLQIEWNEGTDRVGSFSWCGYTCVVTDEVRTFLEQANVECAFGLVEVVRPSKRTRMPRVPFPYFGPRLHWLIPNRRVALSEVSSKVKVVSDCSKCGQRRYAFKRDGLSIDPAVAGRLALFRIEQFEKSAAIFVTEPLLDGLQSQGFTNLCPREAGRIH